MSLLSLLSHWQFTSFYMQTACLFRITFRLRSDEDVERVQKRKSQLLRLEYIVYGFIVIFSVVFSVFAWKVNAIWKLYFSIFLLTTFMCLTLITLASISHI